MEIESGEVDLELVKKRSLVGVISLISRSFVTFGVSIAAQLALSIYLNPAAFGVFSLVSAIVNLFNYFSDIGLAAALIQKKEKVTEEDLRVTFSVQQCLVLFLLLLIFLFSFPARRWFGLNQSAIFLLYSLSFSFFLASLKSIPSVLLERNLRFNLLVIPQILETLVFNVLVIFLAWRGLGLTSFTWAVLARGVVGLVTMYIISPWKIGFSFSRPVISRLLKFGVPYQANTLIAAAKDDLMIIVLGKIIGSDGLGYLTWAKKWPTMPNQFLMDNVSKVVFPAFSRMQEGKENLQRAVEKSLFFLTFLTFPALVGFSVLAPVLIRSIPRLMKWEPAIFALYLYSFNSAWATVSSSMTNLLNAIGKIKKTFKLMIMWLVLTWVLMPLMGIKFGYNGVAIATAIIAFSSIFAILMARKEVNFSLKNSVGKPLVSSAVMGLALFFFRPPIASLTLGIVSRVAFGILVYFFFSYLLVGQSLLIDVQKIYYEFKKKR